MDKFKFDNIEADSLILDFACGECNKQTETIKMKVPEMDIDRAAKYNSLQYIHRCQCGNEYSIKLYNSLNDGYGEIDELSENADLHVNEVPYFEHGPESMLVDVIQALSTNVQIADDVKNLDGGNQNYVLNLLFVNLFSILDSFVKISTYHLIKNDTEYLEKYTKTLCRKKGNKSIIDLFEDSYKYQSFQNSKYRKILFKDVFNIAIEYDDKLDYYLKIRNMIVHRNSLSPKGYKYNVTKEQLKELSGIIKKHIGQIHCELIGLSAEK